MAEPIVAIDMQILVQRLAWREIEILKLQTEVARLQHRLAVLEAPAPGNGLLHAGATPNPSPAHTEEVPAC